MPQVSDILTCDDGVYEFYCPGCKGIHAVSVDRPSVATSAQWKFNGDVVKPTFTPSLLVNGSRPGGRCHSFIKDGQIQFLGDCYHELKDQTVPVPDLPDWMID